MRADPCVVSTCCSLSTEHLIINTHRWGQRTPTLLLFSFQMTHLQGKLSKKQTRIVIGYLVRIRWHWKGNMETFPRLLGRQKVVLVLPLFIPESSNLPVRQNQTTVWLWGQREPNDCLTWPLAMWDGSQDSEEALEVRVEACAHQSVHWVFMGWWRWFLSICNVTQIK